MASRASTVTGFTIFASISLISGAALSSVPHAATPHDVMMMVEKLSSLPNLIDPDAVGKLLKVGFRVQVGPIIHDEAADPPGSIPDERTTHYTATSTSLGSIELDVTRNTAGHLMSSPFNGVHLRPMTCIKASDLPGTLTGRPEHIPFFGPTFSYQHREASTRTSFNFEKRSGDCTSAISILQVANPPPVLQPIPSPHDVLETAERLAELSDLDDPEAVERLTGVRFHEVIGRLHPDLGPPNGTPPFRISFFMQNHPSPLGRVQLEVYRDPAGHLLTNYFISSEVQLSPQGVTCIKAGDVRTMLKGRPGPAFLSRSGHELYFFYRTGKKTSRIEITFSETSGSDCAERPMRIQQSFTQPPPIFK